MMIKVLYVHNSLDLGGAQSVRYMFLKHLHSNSLKINICCLGEKGELGRKIEELGYRVEAFNKPHSLSCFSTTLKLYRYIKENNFDIVHSSLFYANYHSGLAAHWARVPFLISEEHGEHYLHAKRRYLIYRLAGRQSAKMSNLIFCCSDYVKRGIQHTYNVKEEKIAVLKNLVEDKRQELKRSRKAVRAELNIPFDAILIGTVSSLYWLKNQRLLIDLIAQSDGMRLFLVMVGDGPLKNELIEYARRRRVSSRVCFTGWRSDVADILNCLDVFVLPSISEGLPICLLEAMSMGLPCIASRAGGIEELLEDGRTGILVAPGNLDDLSLALKRVINQRSLALKLGSSARQYARDYFQPAGYVNRVVDLYHNLIKK